MIFYIALAFIEHHRQEILMAEEYILPQTMAHLTLKRKEDVYEVFVKAIELRKSTPLSFQYFIINERIFSPLIDSDELEALLLRIERLPALPLTMSELLFYCFPGKIQCCNPFCKNGLPIKNTSNIPSVTITQKGISTPTGFSTASTKRYNEEGKVLPSHSFASEKGIDRVGGSVKLIKDPNSRKNIGQLNNSLDNSPGKLMNTVKLDHSQKYKPPKKSPHFGQTAESTRKSGSPKTLDFTNRSESNIEE